MAVARRDEESPGWKTRSARKVGEWTAKHRRGVRDQPRVTAAIARMVTVVLGTLSEGMCS